MAGIKVSDGGKYGISFNDWNEAYHKNGRENGGTEWLEDQMITLRCAIENAKGLDIYYTTPQPTDLKWNFK